MMGSTLEGLTQRLDRLERENRRLKRVGAVFLVGIAAVVLMGQARTGGKVVEAEQFVLRDASGKSRGGVTVGPDGGAGLLLSGQEGKGAVLLSVSVDGTPVLDLMDKTGRLRAQFKLAPDGSPGLILYDRGMKGRAWLIVGTNDMPLLSFFDRDGKSTWSVP